MCHFWFFSYYCVVIYMIFVTETFKNLAVSICSLKKTSVCLCAHVYSHTHIHNILHPAQSCCGIILPCLRSTGYFYAFLLNHSTVFASQYHNEEPRILRKYLLPPNKQSDIKKQAKALKINFYPSTVNYYTSH